MKFKDLKIIDPILKALSDKQYHKATPIQKQAIPYILQGRDILGSAQTGTGKTAAFAIPIIQRIAQADANKGKIHLRALIMTPTRELAIQIDDNIKAYAKYTGLKHQVIFGGVKQGKQVDKLKKGIHILTATPGRLLDLQNQGYINLDNLKIFVLDEADRMLDMGFIHDIKKLLRLLPRKRQSLFFSATLPKNIVSLSDTILDNPHQIEVASTSSTADTVEQEVYYTNLSDKKELLIHILKSRVDDQALIFSRTKHGADKIVRFLKSADIKAVAIHGNKSQNQRQGALKDFKSGKAKIMVATDIASRGIDIDKLKYVVNYNVPNVPEDYVHRIGRTGRAGENGLAITVCEAEENIFVRQVEKLTGKKLKRIEDHPFQQTDKPMTEKEKKAFNKEKERKKHEMIALRRARMKNKSSKSSTSRNDKPKGNKSFKKKKKRY